jgi:energy-coupling factor transporter ATP-binding protein EcfA2
VNKLLNTYLQKFNAETLFYFDSEFNEVIGTRYKESFSYFNFSEGQKRRIDLAILFAMTEFSKIKNRKAACNIMILDEISSMMDSDGENGLYDILKDLVTKENKCVVTISHSGNIDPEKIAHLYDVKIEKGFSKITKVAS